MEKNFFFTPFVGAGPLVFGKSASEIWEILGTPDVQRENWKKKAEEFYINQGIHVVYRLGEPGAESFEFLPDRGVALIFRESNLLSINNSDLWLILSEADNCPVKIMDTILFRGLGLSIPDIRSLDVKMESLTISARGAWDELIPLMEQISGLNKKP